MRLRTSVADIGERTSDAVLRTVIRDILRRVSQSFAHDVLGADGEEDDEEDTLLPSKSENDVKIESQEGAEVVKEVEVIEEEVMKEVGEEAAADRAVLPPEFYEVFAKVKVVIEKFDNGQYGRTVPLPAEPTVLPVDFHETFEKIRELIAKYESGQLIHETVVKEIVKEVIIRESEILREPPSSAPDVRSLVKEVVAAEIAKGLVPQVLAQCQLSTNSVLAQY